MARILIIGYGNPLRGDDGLGWHAAQCLAPALAGLDVETITCHQLTPDLAEPVSRAECVIFIDAQAGGPAGKLTMREVAATTGHPALLSHSLDPGALLASAQQIYQNSPRGFILSVTGQSFAYSEELSPEVQSTLPELLRVAHKLAIEGPGGQGTRDTGETHHVDLPSAVVRTHSRLLPLVSAPSGVRMARRPRRSTRVSSRAFGPCVIPSMRKPTNEN